MAFLSISGWITCVLAGLVTTGLCWFVDHYGGILGGVINGMPHVAIIGAIGFYYETDSEKDFFITMVSMPSGMLVNTIYYASYYYLAPFWMKTFPDGYNMPRVAGLLSCSMIYITFIAIATLILTETDDKKSQMRIFSYVSFAILCTHSASWYFGSEPKPRGSKTKSTARELLTRFILTVICFMLAVFCSRTFPQIAGPLANFPIFTTIVIFNTWRMRDGEFTSTSLLNFVPSCIMGIVSACAYPLIAVELMLSMNPILGALVAWAICVLFFTLPIFFLMRQRDAKAQIATQSKSDIAI